MRAGFGRFFAAWAGLMLVAACGPELDPPAWATGGRGLLTQVSSFGSNPGGLRMYKYVPQGAPANAPLVLALHACTQTAANYENAGWNSFADQWGFHVVYPEQDPSNNPARCFNWAGEYGDPTNLTRGEGENESIKQMVDKMIADHSIDPNRVYLSGHSGGAAQIALMLATWPDVFAGGAMIAGIPYDCTTTFTEVTTCLNPGIDRTPAQWGDRARAGFPGYSGPYPKVSIWHGTGDTTVAIRNMTELLEQWTNVHGVDQMEDASSVIDGATKKEYKNGAGVTVVETYEIPGMGHGTPVVPSEGCGSAGAYFIDAGICATARIGAFFGLASGGVEDTTAPSVRFTAPADGATVGRRVNLSASASDDFGVARVEFQAGGASIGRATAPPYEVEWDATSVAAGAHDLVAIAYDSAGNQARDEIIVTVDPDLAGDTTPPSASFASLPGGEQLSGVVTVEVNATDDTRVNVVLLFLDGELIGSDYRGPAYEFLWDTAIVEPGSYTLTARAFDDAGNFGVAEVLIEVVPPGTDKEPQGGDPGAEPGDGEPKEGEPILIGKRRWGCSAMPDGAEPGAVLLVLFSTILVMRRGRNTCGRNP